MTNRLLASAALAAALAAAPAAVAHDSPQHRIDELSIALSADPANAALLLERAELYRVLERWPEGLLDLQCAARLAPSMHAVHLATASLLLQAGAIDPALEAVDRFLAADGEHAAGHLLRARILRRSGRDLDAAAEYSRGIALASGRATPDDYLERAAALAEERRFDDAIRGLDDGIAALGAPITLQLAAIDLELRRSAYDDALRRLSAVEATASRRESWIFRRAEVLELAGRRAEAAAACREALDELGRLAPRVRRIEATAALERKIRSKLAGLDAAAAEPAPIDAAPPSAASSTSAPSAMGERS